MPSSPGAADHRRGALGRRPGLQQKCLGRMETVAREGRTMLFVSHNLTAVSKLCSRSMLLEDGRQPPPTHRAVLVDHGWTLEEAPLEAPQPAGAMPR